MFITWFALWRSCLNLFGLLTLGKLYYLLWRHDLWRAFLLTDISIGFQVFWRFSSLNDRKSLCRRFYWRFLKTKFVGLTRIYLFHLTWYSVDPAAQWREYLWRYSIWQTNQMTCLILFLWRVHFLSYNSYDASLNS